MSSYREHPALNFSALKHMAHSPAMYRHRRDNPEPDKPAYVLGRATHCLVLEPDEFAARYVTWDGGARRGKAWTDFQAAHEGLDILTVAEYEAARVMADVVAASPQARAWLDGRHEVELYWEFGGRRLKGRADCIAGGCICDLKTTHHSDPRLMLRDLWTYHVHAQLAMYTDGALACGLLTEPPGMARVVYVTPGPPADVVCVRLRELELADGRAHYQTWLQRIADCEATDTWPGVAPGVLSPDVPGWATCKADAGGDLPF